MKKKVIAILLSLSMIVGIMPTLAFATSGETTPVSETTAPTESTPSVCPVCQTENCTAEHKQCEICKAYDCAKTHVFCETCQKYDCGVDHNVEPVSEPELCTTCGKEDCSGQHENWCETCKKDNCGIDHSAPKTCETCGEALSEGHICPTDPVCSCSVLCKADAPKSDCPVCSTEGGVCTGSDKYVTVQAMIDALRTEFKESEREAALAEYEAVTKAIGELSEEEFALLDLTNYYAAANPTVIPEENIVCYIGEQGYASLSDALTNAEDNAIIVVHENITSMPTISKPVTIKGYAADRGIQVNCHIAENFPNVTGTVTFEDLTFNERISTETSATSQENMTLKFVNCTFNVPAGNTYAIQAGASGTNDVLGNLEISQCTFNAAEKAKEGEASTFTGGYMIYAQCVKNVSITDCIINGKDNYRGAIHLGDSTSYATKATVSRNQIKEFCRGIVIGNRVTDSSISISGNTFTDIKYNSDDKDKTALECAPIFIHENANAGTTNVSVTSNAFNSIQNTYVIYNENTAENESSEGFIATFTGNTVNSGSVTGETQNVFSDWGAPTIGITAKAMTKNYGAALLESDAGGTVSQSEETETWAAAANSGYEFKGWFTDEVCTQKVTESWVDADNKLTPQKNSEGLYESGSFYALFEEKTTTVTYNVLDVATGSLCFEGESAEEKITDTFGMVTGSPKTATAKPVNGYMFVGWYTDESCTVLHSTNAALNSSENGTFYAKFIKDHATVTITKTIDKASSSDQSFILNISGTTYNNDPVNVDVVIVISAGQTSGCVKVVLPVSNGDYSISDQDGWNWRNKVKNNATITINGGDSDSVLDVKSTLENGKWFADSCVYPYKKES